MEPQTSEAVVQKVANSTQSRVVSQAEEVHDPDDRIVVQSLARVTTVYRLQFSGVFLVILITKLSIGLDFLADETNNLCGFCSLEANWSCLFPSISPSFVYKRLPCSLLLDF